MSAAFSPPNASQGREMTRSLSTYDAEYEFSIIVPTYNEARNLPRLLQSLSRQRSVGIEVIVVDQESTDMTAELAADSGCMVLTRPRAHFYSPPAASRNAGAAASSGTYLVHLDADMELPDDDFLASLRALFSDHVQAIVIHERDVATGYWSHVKAVERLCYVGSSIESARGVTRALFNEVDGYNTKISSGEDYDISCRYATRTSIHINHPLTVNHHTGRVLLRNLLIKKFNYGRTVTDYLTESRASGGPTALSLIWTDLTCYIRRWDLLTKDPFHYLGIFVLRGLELGAIAFGMGYAKASRKLTAALPTSSP